jgi:hypothetical protein
VSLSRRLAVLAIALAAMTTPLAARAAEPAEGPKSLLITYRAESPAERPAFRRYLAHEEWRRLAAWKRDGVIKDFQILFNPFQSKDTWDAMLVLRFAAFSDTGKWIAIERDLPGGLDAAGLKLAHPVDTYSADADWAAGDEGAAADAKAVFYVIPYEFGKEDQYRSYVDGYVIPQVRGWMKQGVLTGYSIFMNRYPVGPQWDSLFVYRYKDLDAFGKRQATVAKVRQGLVADPAWTRWNEIKSGIRTESTNVVAEAIQGE